jgi:ribosomal protein L40E
MQKIMILPVCLGILLFGVAMVPVVFADGCGPGTVLIDGVCELAPVQESSEGCGSGTVMVDGVCELDETAKSTSMSIEPLYVIIAVVAIGGIIGAIFAVRKGSKTPKPTQQESVTKERIKTSSEFCQSCGTTLKPGAKFCGKCGTPRS